MSDKLLKQRADIDSKFKWDIEAMYPDEAQWEKDIADCVSAAEKFTRFFLKPSTKKIKSGESWSTLLSTRR